MAENTVYVIGAGASCEIDMPVGNELKDLIAKTLLMKFGKYDIEGGNHDLYRALKLHTKDEKTELNEYLVECRHISDNMPLAISIDNFLDTEKENKRLSVCGKIAIVDSILKAEKKSIVYVDPSKRKKRIDFSKLGSTWYLPFFQSLTENLSAGDLPARFSKIALIIFNYDRCVEYFLINALKNYYRLEHKDARDILSNLSIIHPYGTVGELPSSELNSQDGTPYGHVLEHYSYVEQSNLIRTFTEGTSEEKYEELQQWMSTASRLVFLGFAYHRINMELLSNAGGNPYDNRKQVTCYGTAYGSSESDQRSIRSAIDSMYLNETVIHLEDEKCSQFYQNYSRSLGYD